MVREVDMVGVSVVAFGLGGFLARRVKVLALIPTAILAFASSLVLGLMLEGSVEYGLKAGVVAVVCIQVGYIAGLSIPPRFMRGKRLPASEKRATVRTVSCETTAADGMHGAGALN
jgi:hypothetical protein